VPVSSRDKSHGKPYAALLLGESHSNDLQLAFDCVEAFVLIGLRWGHELVASIRNLGNGSSVVALDESCERHRAILASQFWAGHCESAEQNEPVLACAPFRASPINGPTECGGRFVL
jgi:hypothetical protein